MAVRAPGRFGLSWKIVRGLAARGPVRALPSFGRAEKPRSAARGLSLTSMIDVMVVLVVFMLLQFVAPDPCGCITRRIDVPTATEVADIVDAPMVSVTRSMVLVDGSVAADAADLETPTAHRLDGVFNVLKGKREVSRIVAPGRPAPTHVILAIDRDVPARVVKSVTMTAAASGFPDIDFMVAAAPRVD